MTTESKKDIFEQILKDINELKAYCHQEPYKNEDFDYSNQAQFEKLLREYYDLMKETHGVGEEYHGRNELMYIIEQIFDRYQNAQ